MTETFARLMATAVAIYLVKSGWTRMGERSGGTVWIRRSDEGVRHLFQPEDTTSPDYALCVGEMVADLATIEHRSQLGVLVDVDESTVRSGLRRRPGQAGQATASGSRRAELTAEAIRAMSDERSLREQYGSLSRLHANMYLNIQDALRVLDRAGIPEHGPTQPDGFARVFSLEERVELLRHRSEGYETALRQIASCEPNAPGDVVHVARVALAAAPANARAGRRGDGLE